MQILVQFFIGDDQGLRSTVVKFDLACILDKGLLGKDMLISIEEGIRRDSSPCAAER